VIEYKQRAIMSHTLQFNERRTTQTAAEFLKKANGRLNYMVLIKFLYLADRAALLNWGTPLTGDTYLSMRWGPVLSATHDLITEPVPEQEDATSFWRTHVATDHYDVVLTRDPGNEELSLADEELIAGIFNTYHAKFRELGSNPFDFCEYLHTLLPEYRTAQHGQRFPLDHHDILVAGKKSPEDIREVESLISGVSQMQRVR
jgi:hypothetical protein